MLVLLTEEIRSSIYKVNIKMFFGYDRRHSVTMMLMDLRLPTSSTILRNAAFKLRESVLPC